MGVGDGMLPIELKYFEEVAKSGSIREAADRLRIAGSAVSRQVSKLEETTGAALFKRTSNGMKLTQAGRVLLDYVHRCRSDIEATKAKIRDVVAMRSGDLIIYAPEGLIDELLVQSIAEFHRKYANVQIIIRTSGSEEAVRSLLHNTSDIALVLNASQRQDIEVVATIDQTVGLVALSADGSDLWDGPLAVVDATHELHSLARTAMEAAELSSSAAFSGNSIAWVKHFVRSGLGIGLLPRTAVEREVASGMFVYREIVEADPEPSKIHICVRRDWSHAVAADEFLQILLRRVDLCPVRASCRKENSPF